jgi:hypothetical protein
MASASDDFLRTDSSTLGANWTKNASGEIGIVSNQAKFNSGATGFCSAVYTGVTWSNDQSSQVALKVGESGKDYGVCVRAAGSSDATVSGYYFVINDADAAITLGSSSFSVGLYKSTGGTGSFTPIGSSVTGQTISVSDVVSIEVSGTTIVCKINGVTKITQTDSSIASGKPGIYISGSGGTTTFDDWAGADLVASGDTQEWLVRRPESRARRDVQVIY